MGSPLEQCSHLRRMRTLESGSSKPHDENSIHGETGGDISGKVGPILGVVKNWD
jgi:hypothetical protein